MGNKKKPVPWERVLYKKQPYPENYVHKSFLKSLRMNSNKRHYKYWDLVLTTLSCISLHFNLIFLFINVFLNLDNERLDGTLLMFIDLGLFAVGFTAWFELDKLTNATGLKVQNVLKSALIITCVLFCLAPMLRTLTFEVSSDSIWAFTTISLVGNAVSHDYRVNSNNTNLPSSVSSNAAIFAAILLGSRLPEHLQVIGLTGFAIILFGLAPTFLKNLQRTSMKLSSSVSLMLFILCNLLFYIHNKTLTYFYNFFTIFVIFVCPAWFIWAQRYKNEIKGPWDEAKPKTNSLNNK